MLVMFLKSWPVKTCMPYSVRISFAHVTFNTSVFQIHRHSYKYTNFYTLSLPPLRPLDFPKTFPLKILHFLDKWFFSSLGLWSLCTPHIFWYNAILNRCYFSLLPRELHLFSLVTQHLLVFHLLPPLLVFLWQNSTSAWEEETALVARFSKKM